MRRGRAVKNLALQTITLCLCLFFAAIAHAQIPTYTSPQTVFQTLTGASPVACTGSAQIFPIQNLGQTQHSVLVSSVNAFTQLQLEIDAVDNAGNIFRISDVGQNGTGTNVTASAAYPLEEAKITCLPTSSNFTLTYSGTSSTPPVNAGVAFITSIDKVVLNGVTSNTSVDFPPPFGSSSGQFTVQHGTNATADIQIDCFNSTDVTAAKFFVFPLLTTATTETFTVPPATCPSLAVSYFETGASGSLILEYFFDPPGLIPNNTLGQYRHITGTTAVSVKGANGGGTLTNLTVNTPAAGTISIFDLGLAACVGTPATNVVAVITATATVPIATLPYNLAFRNGICVQASAVMDITVGFQ